MEYDELARLRQHSPAWRLLRAEHAPLLLSFLGQVFVQENIREISESELATRLDDELFALNERLGAGTFPRPAKAYLDDWASESAGWLRKYYATAKEEPQYDALPALEKAMTFVDGLRSREFIGTESRLNTLFDLLRQMAYGTETDPAKRLAELHRQRAEIDQQISEVEQGRLDLLDTAAQRDRFQQFTATARDLLSDFREVEANFRALDSQMRAEIAAWTGSRGELLEEVLTNRGDISSSEQGRSFSAFYDFLLSSRRQTEFESLLDHVLALDALAGTDPRTRRVHYDWLAAGERTQRTVRMLSEQLRRFLDDAVWLENRRIIEILGQVQSHAVALRDRAELPGMELDAFAPTFRLPTERRLYSPREKCAIDSDAPIDTDTDTADATVLFGQTSVDTAALVDEVRAALARAPQINLSTLVDSRPLEEGLAELLAYFGLDDDRFGVLYDEEAIDEIPWEGFDGVVRTARAPRVTFFRTLGQTAADSPGATQEQRQ